MRHRLGLGDGQDVIRTVALNPAVDVSVVVPELLAVHKLRASSSRREAGGGGVNVARLLRSFGAEVECVVASGGPTGAEVVEALKSLEVVVSVLPAVGDTRESIQIHDSKNDVRYRVTLAGAPLEDSPERVLDLMSAGRTPGVNVLSGSLPPGCPATIYADLSLLHPTAFTIVDTSGVALAASVAGSVDLIKPSLRELETLAGHDITNAIELRRAIEKVLESHAGLGSVFVSLGGAGAVFGQRNHPAMRLVGPQVSVVSAVGAGDSVVAGVAWGVHRGQDLLDSCRLGVAAGTATVATPGSALCSATSALKLVDSVQTSELRPTDTIR